MSYTQIKILQTSEHPVGSGELDKYANDIQSAWNSAIEDANDDYSMYTKVDESISVEIDDRSDMDAARGSASDYLTTNHADLFGDDSWDGVLVADSYSYSNDEDRGVAPIGQCPPQDGDEHLVAGGGVEEAAAVPVALVTNATLVSGMGAHEVGHLYGGNHGEYEHWGVAEYTAMGTPGAITCYGNETGRRVRRADYGSCAVTAIRDYMDHWSGEGYFNPQTTRR